MDPRRVTRRSFKLFACGRPFRSASVTPVVWRHWTAPDCGRTMLVQGQFRLACVACSLDNVLTCSTMHRKHHKRANKAFLDLQRMLTTKSLLQRHRRST
jgi:hypothetical protein